MLRPTLAVIGGFVAWTLLWIVGAAIATAAARIDLEAARIDDTTPLLILIAVSVVCSLAAGATCAAINARRAGRPVIVLTGLLLAVGVAVEASSWSAYPVWYHLTFLVLLAPATILGARIAARPGPPAGTP